MRLRPSTTPALALPIVLLWLLGCTFGPAFALEREVRTSSAPEREVTPPARGRFLVARRGMPDPRFARTVVLLIAYGDEGAMGLIVNRATRLDLNALWAPAASADVAWYGGPVQSNVASALIDNATPPSEGTIRVLDGLHYSTEREILEGLMRAPDATRFRIYLGYAGWAPQQLDAELARGDWHVRSATLEQVFSDEGERLWESLLPARGRWVRRVSPARARRVSLRHGIEEAGTRAR